MFYFIVLFIYFSKHVYRCPEVQGKILGPVVQCIVSLTKSLICELLSLLVCIVCIKSRRLIFLQKM